MKKSFLSIFLPKRARNKHLAEIEKSISMSFSRGNINLILGQTISPEQVQQEKKQILKYKFL
jgi:hypothetical protein